MKTSNIKPKITLYQAVIKILNQKLDYKVDIITRQELIKKLFDKYKFYGNTKWWKHETYDKEVTNYSLSTMDSIRNMLEKVGFLDKVYHINTNDKKPKQGWFYLKKKIPSNLTYNKLRLMYNNFQQKLKDYFTEYGRQPDEVDKYILQMKVQKEFIENKILN